MRRPRIPKLFSSIFVKLMAVILVAGMGINLAIIACFGIIRHHVASNYHPHLVRYVDYLLKDIGSPPDQDRATEITAGTTMVITYEGRDRSWSTAPPPIDFPLDRIRIRHQDGRLKAGGYRGRYMVSVQLEEGRLTFLMNHKTAAEKKIRLLGAGLLIFITGLMICAYLSIRWVLKPLRWLKQGVDQVSRGELEHRVPEERSDELRDLSASFNTMTRRLRHLLTAKEQLLLDVSHELRSPLTRIKVALAMMPESANRTSIEEDLAEMQKKISELLNTARSLNTKASLNLADVDVVDLIRKAALPFESGRPAIEMDPMPAPVVLTLDAARISQVMKNVLENAQKYSPDDALPIRISIAKEAASCIISIEDHGIGISEEDLDFVFEPFYRADKARTPQRDGYGLGLNLARSIVEAHGGKILLTSKIGHGTQVRIHLPRVLSNNSK